LGVVVHFLGRRLFYGDWLPNTFYAKVDGIEIGSGLTYLGEFATSFPVAALVVVFSLLWAGKDLPKVTFKSFVFVLVLSYCLYVVTIGGGFMEFRLLDVILPFGYILAGAGVIRLTGKLEGQPWRVGVFSTAAVLIVLNVFSSLGFENSRHKVLTWTQMTEQTTDVWILIGKWFGRVATNDESIATGSCGAIPYYSGLRCLDMRGLNDRYVARLEPTGAGPVGHRKVAPLEYLRQRKITYVVFPTRVFPLDNYPRPGPDEFLVEIENPDPDLLGGQNFLLLIRSPSEKVPLIESLRRRHVRVLSS
jgi:hypothetical protein